MDRQIAVVCASNQNRSMETHALLVKKGFKYVSSFGTNSQVKLPGTAADKPVVFDFSVPYTQMYDHLKQIDEELYPFIDNNITNIRNQPPLFIVIFDRH